MNNKKPGLRYRDAGVDIDAADAALREVKDVVQKTFDENVLCGLGSFGAMYGFSNISLEEPVLVSSVDGVGTKLKLAFMTGKHDTVGIDLVSHCVNDILVQGARPIFFLDYLACGRLRPETVVAVIKGIAAGCRYAGCSLIGGETAEMPDMYGADEYDLAGTIVGVVERKRIIDGSAVRPGDVIIGLPSSGLHTNGYSLARKICFELAGLTVDDEMPGTGRSVGAALLEPHRSYAKLIQLLMKLVTVRGMTHVTGGGITDNLPRTLPKRMGAEIDLAAWEALPIFEFLQKTGNVSDDEMLRTFNMGMGYLVIVGEQQVELALDTLTQAGEEPSVVGRVIAGENKVNYTGSIRYAA
ncbi:MAG TPA: phosphoribosylformylglycinamidine cyclo-ligase [Candidatus Hydrogenedentes bacterium]|nr:phosphoribosylformylglycinamidine cyclo-ligase [Candidatus Hydrogenedentota bacterium]HIJ72808.1 phosphoribosylformylglycinamidine cyclo-ligase [Candidatus Hydrogenedentota bacterium]